MSRTRLIAAAVAAIGALGVANAQTVLLEETATDTTYLYTDGGAATGAATQNKGHIVKVEKWVCPLGYTRPADGVVEVDVPGTTCEPGVFICRKIEKITLGTRQCIIKPDGDVVTRVTIDQVADMVKARNAGYYITVGTQGDRLAPDSPASVSGATAAKAIGAAAAGYYSECSSTAFDLLSASMPDPKKDPSGYACFMDYLSHIR